MYLRRFLFLFFAMLAIGPPFLLAQGQSSGSVTSTQCISISVSGQSTVGVQVTGTWTGTLVPKVSVQGQSPQTIQVFPGNSSTAQSSITANGFYQAKVAGGSTFLLCGSTVSSGTANVYLNASEGVAVIVPNGSLTAAGVLFPIAGATAPTPVGTNTCPAAMNVAGWTQNASGTYETQFAVDTSLTIPAAGDTRYGSPGILTFCRPVIFNSTGTANPGGARNGQAFNIYGNFDLFTNSGFLVQSEYINSVSDSQTYTTGNLNSYYSELELNGTPTMSAVTFLSTYRARMDDNKTGGSKPRVWSVYQGDTEKTAVYDITNCTAGINGFSNGPCYSIFYGQVAANVGVNEDETGATYDVFSGGTKDAGNHALNATGNVFHALVQGSTGNRFVNSNGFLSEDFGTAAGYYNFLSKGVNAAGTPSGYNAFVGPISLGSTTHPTSGIQVDVSGGALRYLTLKTTTNCAASGTAANPSVVSCTAAPAGAVYCDVAASGGTCTVNTTAVTSTSRIFITLNGADGTELSKTCNTSTISAVPTELYASKVAGTSFTINMPTLTTNGACFEYTIVN